MLRVAMLSFAHVHANGYAQHVVDHPEAEITMIWEDDKGRAEAAHERFGAPVSENLEEVLSSPNVDAVVINSYTSQHCDLMLAAVRHGKHIFTEKALAVTTKDADDIAAAVHKSNIKFMISLPSRTRPENLFVKQVLDQGLLGKISLMRARVAHNASLDHWFHGGSAWFADAEKAGGGALFDLGCHTVDVMRWFMGEPKGVISKIQQFSDAYPIDDNSAIVVEFKNGGLGILDTAWVQRSGPNPMEIYGTEGFIGRDFNGQLVLSGNRFQPEGLMGSFHPNRLPDALPMPMDQWISAILHGTDMTITVDDGRNLTQLLEAAYKSAEKKCEVTF